MDFSRKLTDNLLRGKRRLVINLEINGQYSEALHLIYYFLDSRIKWGDEKKLVINEKIFDDGVISNLVIYEGGLRLYYNASRISKSIGNGTSFTQFRKVTLDIIEL